jgi:hypothetical protein
LDLRVVLANPPDWLALTLVAGGEEDGGEEQTETADHSGIYHALDTDSSNRYALRAR